MEIGGAVALVTGASGGIGSAIAHALHERGAQLVLSGRRRDELERLASDLGGARVEVCDLDDADQLLALAGRVADVDVVVANAALPATGDLADFSVAEIDRALSVNLRAPMVLTHQLLPGMRARGRGHLVYVSSIAGKIPARQLPVYAATKYGLRGFAGCLRQDVSDDGVGVSVVFPGSVVDAGMLADAGLPAAPGTKGVRAAEVAAAVVEAIEQNQAEVDAASRLVRTVVKVAALFPSLLDRAAARQDTKDYADRLSGGLRHLR